ncbi:MAG: primosomal replication protein N [Burkholderiaceae bacterium]|nr:primosomal replication protein N [Burkholderiaceae bacterium]
MNHLVLTGGIAEVKTLRYTPAGLPALDLQLDHESAISEAGQPRQVKVVVKAIALGSVAERLVIQPVGSHWQFTGFLGPSRNGKSVLFHVQEFQQI